MSDKEQTFLKQTKRINWTFLIVQAIILIFLIGYSYSRIDNIEHEQELSKSERKEIRATLNKKADKIEINQSLTEIREDTREIRTMLIQM